MNAYDVRTLLDNLDTARIYAGAEFERLCNNNQHIDACVFQSIRDSIAQNIQLLQSYVICKSESEPQESKSRVPLTEIEKILCECKDEMELRISERDEKGLLFISDIFNYIQQRLSEYNAKEAEDE